MTQKRFTYMEQFNGFCDVYDTGKILSCMRLEYVDKTVNLLNEQHETIQVLKASNGEMEDYLARLEEKNEQLKQSVNNLKDTIIKITIAYQRKYDRTIVDLVDEVHDEDITDLIKELKE